MPLSLAFDFTNHQVVLRAIGLLAVAVLFSCFAYLEYAGTPRRQYKYAIYLLICISFVGLIYVLIGLKGV